MQQVLQLPFLRIRIDREHEYHVHNERAFNIHLSVNSPSERRLIDFIRENYKVDKLKSRSAAQLLGDIIGQVQKQSRDKVFTHKDVSELLKRSIANRSLVSNSERDLLIRQLETIQEVLKPLEGEIAAAKEKSSIKAERSAKIFAGVIFAQFALSQYGTYVAFSWDIMEPIMACVSLSDAIAGYFFWLWCGQPWDLNSFRDHFYRKNFDKILAKNGLNRQEYEQLEMAKE